MEDRPYMIRMIPRNSCIGLAILLLICFIDPCYALIILPNGTEVQKDQIPDLFSHSSLTMSKDPLEFFYDYDCQSCQQALEYLRSFEKKNPDIQITHFNLAYPEENRGLFSQQKSRFNTTKIHYPAVFIGDVVISGSSDIIHYTGPIARAYLNLTS